MLVRQKARRRGFTLVEILVALSILMLGVLALFGTMAPASNFLQRSRSRERATAACQQEVERWRAAGYAAVPLGAADTSVTNSFTPPAELANASGAITFTHVDPNLQPVVEDSGRIRIDATVTWSGPGGDTGTITVTTLLAQ